MDYLSLFDWAFVRISLTLLHCFSKDLFDFCTSALLRISLTLLHFSKDLSYFASPP